jgi:hypothetical protein
MHLPGYVLLLQQRVHYQQALEGRIEQARLSGSLLPRFRAFGPAFRRVTSADFSRRR